MAGDTNERLTSDTTTTGRRRIEELDVIRGFALCGIHVVNVYQQVVFSELFGDQPGLGVTVMPAIVRYGFYERFLPIFTLLFGVGFAIFLASAGSRADRPRVVLESSSPAAWPSWRGSASSIRWSTLARRCCRSPSSGLSSSCPPRSSGRGGRSPWVWSCCCSERRRSPGTE
ncbi:hypothetical protein AB0P16_04905 [Dietzia maris]|uniref:hypothetical protein n=1 Tax=Dietzia maris TaxID=37915 RepID=UPI0034490943